MKATANPSPRAGTKSNRRTGRAIAAGITLALGLTVAGPAAIASAAEPQPVNCGESAVGANTTRLAGTADSALGPLAKWVGGKFADAAGGKVAGFVVNSLFSGLFPDPTSQKLDEISGQLNQISAQITEVQKQVADLSVDIKDESVRADLREINNYVADLRQLYDEAFVPMVTCAKRVAEAKEQGADSTEALAKLEQAKQYFYHRYDSSPAGSVAAKIHTYLVPGPLSILAAKGRALLAENRYLTSDQSAELRSLYQGLSDQEALGIWMQAERFSVANPSVVKQLDAKYLGPQGWVATESANLPPMIPEGIVVDTSKTQGKTTNNATMWMLTPSTYTWKPGDSGQGGVLAEMKRINDTAEAGKGFTDWSVPANAQLQAFLSGKPAGKDPASWLNSVMNVSNDQRTLDAPLFATGQSIWASDAQQKQVLAHAYQCGRSAFKICHEYVTFTVHVGQTLNPTAFTAGQLPALPAGGADWGTAKVNAVAAQLFSVPNRLIPTRTITAMPVDYMAQGHVAGSTTSATSATTTHTHRAVTRWAQQAELPDAQARLWQSLFPSG